jgi:hypothetical protein
VPVELISFTVDVVESKALLSWSTASETNNSGFEVQRKSNSEEWESIGFVTGSGTTTETRSYSFTDNLTSTGNYLYRLKQIDYDGAFQFSDEVEILASYPAEFNLAQNYPNPFNPNTLIEFSIPENAKVKLSIFNSLGEKVTELVNTSLAAGKYSYQWNAGNVATGIYLYELRTENFVSVKKMMLVK